MTKRPATSQANEIANRPTQTDSEGTKSLPSKSQKTEQPRTTRTRIANLKTGQIHYARSDYERDYLSLLMLSPQVIKIREHHSLELAETLEIAKQLGIKHPFDIKTKAPKQIRTHFVITIKGGNEDYDVARTLAKSNTVGVQSIVHMEIERVYWSNRAVDWGIVTEREFPKVLRDNAYLLYPYISISGIGRIPEDLNAIALSLTEIVVQKDLVLSEAVQLCDEKFRLVEGTSIRVVYYLIASHHWQVDLLKPIRPNQCLCLEGHTAIDEIDTSVLR